VVSGERSFVLMLWEPFVDDGQYPFLSVRDHFAKHRVQVPSVVAKAPELGLVLLEDLGDLTLERKFWESQSPDAAMPFYRLAIDELVKMHYPATFDRDADCVAFKVQFDAEKLLWEMNYGREHLVLGLCKAKPSAAETKAIDKIFSAICERLHAEEKFIAHRDYHSRNAMIKLGRLRVIDFQDARMGPIQYDLVSLLRDSYVSIGDGMASELIAYYLDLRREACKGRAVREGSRAHFEEIYELQTIQRCFKACGSFSSFFNLRADRRYVKYIHHTMQAVKRSLALFPQYRAFSDALDSHGVFDESFSELV
jgi:aminoglycoside/choline kinase family phosphotransferase